MKGYQRYSSPIQICSVSTIKDAAGGNKSTIEIINRELIAFVYEKSINRTDESGRLVFQKVYKIELWTDPTLIITPKHYIKYEGLKLVIQNIEKDVTKLKDILTLIANN